MKVPKLTAVDGRLQLESGAVILYTYPAGDCDQIPWPLTTDAEKGMLARALYDMREMGGISGGAERVELSDGTLFEISEDNMALYKPPSGEGWLY